jgi:hypothetical protein
MHINRYWGSDWDPWLAYWHVVETFGFAVFACALMILTRSIWLVVIFHGLIDWSIVFDEYTPPDPNEVQWEPSMWQGLTSPLFNLGIFLFLAWLLFKIEKGTVPRWVKRLAIKWKLVEPELSIA